MVMPSITKTMTKAQIEALRERIEPQALSVTRPPYTYFQMKLPSLTITAYQSGKVVYQGQDVSFLEPSESSRDEETFPQAGSDEVGTGDYFGPVVVAACIVSAQAAPRLRALGIQDSKQMDDTRSRAIAPEVKSLCPYSLMIVSNPKYNAIHARHNMNAIKSLLHNQAYLNLMDKGHELPALCVVDQFAKPAVYYRHLEGQPRVVRNLTFETKAENKYLAVACASVLARAAFLDYFDKMAAKYDFPFEKGAGPKVDQCGRRFVERYGFEKLGEVAKMHFKNTEKIRS